MRFVMHGMGERAGHGGLFFKNEEHWRKRMQKVIVKAGGGSAQPIPSRDAIGAHTVAFRPPYIRTGAKPSAPSFRS